MTPRFQKIDYSLLNDEDSAKSSDSEPEMFDNVLETSVRPEKIDIDSDSIDSEPTPVKKPPPKRKLGPKPAAPPKRKIDSDSETSPVKKKVGFAQFSPQTLVPITFLLFSAGLQEEASDRLQRRK